jgi:hypothetical protein
VNDTEAVLLSQAQWLWRVDPFPNDLDATVSFVVPAGARVAAPWPYRDGQYALNRSAFFTDAYTAFGRFERQSFSVGGTQVDVVRFGDRPVDGDVRQWLGRAIRTAGSVGDRFPLERLQFFLVPIEAPGEQVAFGMVRRGGGASVLLVPHRDASLAELESDWVAVHELVHLWLPRLRPRDRWLSEGIATYLQEVLRARCGLQSADRTWGRLQEGFERGRRSGTGRALSVESEDMHRTGAYQRVYWAGAAFAMEADIRLRRASEGEATLLTALSGAATRWVTDASPVSATIFLRALDEESGHGLMEELGAHYAQSARFPDTDFIDALGCRSLREQVTSPSDVDCGVSAVSSR